MPRRELLTPDEREALLAIPKEESERIRHYTLSRANLGVIRQHRWAHNRLGAPYSSAYRATLIKSLIAASRRLRRSHPPAASSPAQLGIACARGGNITQARNFRSNENCV